MAGPNLPLPQTSTNATTGSADGMLQQMVPAWPLSSAVYTPNLDFGHDIQYALKSFLDPNHGQLSATTEITMLRCDQYWNNSQEVMLNERYLGKVLAEKRPKSFNLYCINRFVCRTDAPQPVDARRLRISPTAFRALMTRYEVPTAFIAAVSREFQTCGTGFRGGLGPTTGNMENGKRESKGISDTAWEHWFLLPVRVAVPCGDCDEVHAKSTAGSNQMDPFNYIHLSDAQADVRGSHIGLFMRHDPNSGCVTVICFNFLDGRWPELVDEPLNRIREFIMRQAGGADNKNVEPSFVHQIFLSSAVRWWNTVLLVINRQLIAHEKALQTAMDDPTPMSSTFNTGINKSLHIMTAHLHRYRSELSRLEEVLNELSAVYNSSSTVSLLDEEPIEPSKLCIRLAYEQIWSQLKAVRGFHEELERKIQNILALLFNNIQVTNDRTMQAILKEAQNEAKQSQNVAVQSYELAVRMREDSIAMKTIAILTMVFLPGTSFAALLSMPIFTNSSYLDSPRKIWIWLLLTLPTTAIAFIIYWHVTRQEKKNRPPHPEEGNNQENGNRIANDNGYNQQRPNSQSDRSVGRELGIELERLDPIK